MSDELATLPNHDDGPLLVDTRWEALSFDGHGEGEAEEAREALPSTSTRRKAQRSSRSTKKQTDARHGPAFHWWMLTWNNPSEDWRSNLGSLKAAYAIGQLERGELGTPHIQAVVYFQSTRRNTLWRNKPVWAKGLPKQEVQRSIAYVTKVDTRLDGPYEFGIAPNHARPRRDYAGALELAKKGDYLRCQADVLVPHLANLQKLAVLFAQPKKPDGLRGRWWFGRPGTGKSRTAYEMFPHAYRKAQNKWWDGYDPNNPYHRVVILDDLDRQGVCLSHYLKIWFDQYPGYGEIKGGTVPLNFDILIVTSNYLPSDLWPEDVLLIEAIKRRCIFREFNTTYEDDIEAFLRKELPTLRRSDAMIEEPSDSSDPKIEPDVKIEGRLLNNN